MNIIINGITDDRYKEFEAKLEQAHSKDDKYFKLRDMKINYCQGCFECWVKTPGICVFKDDYVEILSNGPKADKLTIITPIIGGYESSLVKKFKDRFLPMVHPYVVEYKGEQHHLQRYAQNPDFRVIVLEDEDTIPEDLMQIEDLYNRVSLNLRFNLIEVVSIKQGEDYDHVITSI